MPWVERISLRISGGSIMWKSMIPMPMSGTTVPSLLTRGAMVLRQQSLKIAFNVIGGRGWPSIAQNGPYLATIDVYEPGNRWRKKTDLPSLRYGFSSVVVADEIYLIGGLEGATFDQHVKTVESYHPKARDVEDKGSQCQLEIPRWG